MALFDEIEDVIELLRMVFRGRVNLRQLPKDVYELNRKAILEETYAGFGNRPEELAVASARRKLAESLERNVNVFSAAKTFQQVKEMGAEVVDANGNKRKFEEFEKIGKQVFDKYNRRWLKTEQDTAFTGAQSASDWQRIEENKDLFPYLRYETVGDSKVRDEHEDMEGIIKPVDDAFWSTYMPPNGWNCRCPKPKQLRSGTPSDASGISEPEDLFKKNDGKDGMLFKEDVGDGIEHPYFRVDERYEVVKQNGFGLA